MSETMERFRVKGRTFREILNDVNAIMKERGIEPEESDFSTSNGQALVIWPARETTNLRWVACFPVLGANEGFYVHIELIFQEMYGKKLPSTGERLHIGTAKCFSFANAIAMANCAAEIFEGRDSFKRRDDWS